ncbi:MAG: ABC transporter ATP-binding protein [Caldilineaceae bacterium]
MNSPTILVKARNLHKCYGAGEKGVAALRGIDLSVAPGEFVALVGPTGSGKTTLLSLLAGLEEPDAGQVVLAGQDLASLSEDGIADLRGRSVGMIYQSINLFAGFSVLENVGLPLRLMLRPPFDAHSRARELLAAGGLTSLAARYPADLSGGQRQLVAIARALAADPPLILADEPTANLDSASARQITGRLRGLVDDGRHGVLLATHDLRVASQADRVISLRDGQIVKETALGAGRPSREVLAELA